MDHKQKSIRQTTLTAENPNYIEVEKEKPKVEKHNDLSPSVRPALRAHPVSSTEIKVHLADQITSGKRKGTPGVTTTATVTTITSDTAEFLYLTNSYVKRGITLTSNAILRNGYEVITQGSSDSDIVELFRKDFDNKLQEICTNTLIHGMQLIELFMGSDDAGVLTSLVPPKEAAYKTDVSGNILYDNDGLAEGYNQTRDGKEIAEWDADTIANVRFETISGAETGISILQPAIYPVTEYGIIRGNIADSFIRGLPVTQIVVSNGTSEDMAEISGQLARQFTAESVYVTSDRFDMKNIAAGVSSVMDVANFIEPSLSDIAACFYMPVEMIANTKNIGLDSDVFLRVYDEWIQTIREKQATLAHILETEVYDRVTAEPVEVKFNNPQQMSPLALIKNVGYAVQSGAITEKQAQNILTKAQVFGVDIDEDN
ncbi:hypothetical protein KAR91_59575 [Candidatus Pacearchaeota archaeon]|nr:hypothetical protein [Candidatus Pacearchaeota archaeon]